MSDDRHPRDRFITIYGRKPVLELLGQPDRQVARVLLDRRARGPVARDILARAEARGVEVERVEAALATDRRSLLTRLEPCGPGEHCHCHFHRGHTSCVQQSGFG